MTAFESEYRVVVLQRPMRVYRGCFTHDAAEEDFKSNYERGRSPHPADLRATVLHMAVSMFGDRNAVRYLAGRYPRRVGEFVAALDLQPGFGVCDADTSGPGHWSVWGRPAQLRDFVASIERA
jgi:glutathione synthase/RimK-type ligase-like ATP-grasp enzyme